MRPENTQPKESGFDAPLPNPEPASESAPGELVQLPTTTFVEKFASAEKLTIGESECQILKLALFPHARIFAPLLRLIPNYFRVDMNFVRAVGRATCMVQFQAEVRHFMDDEGHCGFLRGKLRLRVSVRRLRALARRFLPEGGVVLPVQESTTFESLPPFSPTRHPRRRQADGTPPINSNTPFGNGQGAGGRSAPSAPDVQLLERELARIREQREILKKAIGVLSED